MIIVTVTTSTERREFGGLTNGDNRNYLTCLRALGQGSSNWN